MLKVQECVFKRLLLFAICIGYAAGCSSVHRELIVSGISSLTVQRGHTAVITNDTYNIIYNETEYLDCIVYVTSTPTFSCGAILPDVFNCNNRSRPNLAYTHYGCDRNTETIDLAFTLISSDRNAITTEHFTIEITLMGITDPILKPSDKIILPADSNKAAVTLKLSGNLDCEYAIVSPIALPYYGNVTGPIKQWLACNSSQSLEYRLAPHQWHQSEDRIIIAVRINSTVSYEQIPVIINSVNNTGCTVEQGVVSVAFNCYTPVSLENFNAQNCPFPTDWKLQVAKSTTSGISLLTSNIYRRQSLTYTFTLGQLADGMVAYHRKTLSDILITYQYSVLDVHGGVILNNSIVTKNTPLFGQYVEVIINAGIDVLEGQSVIMTCEELQLLDNGCTSVTLTLVENPRYGYFRLTRSNATLIEVEPHDIKSGYVIYEHSGADGFIDHAIWEVHCSNITIGRLIQPIHVIPVDDSPPYLKENSVLLVHSNSVAQLSQFHLQAVDVDSCDATLKYTILRARGQFYNSEEDALGNNITKITEFRQQDIIDGNIWYKPPQDINTPESDVILFSVSDESSPPNVLSNQNFTVDISISYVCTFCEATLDLWRLSHIPVVEIAGEIHLSTTHFIPFTAPYDWMEMYIVDPPQFGSVTPNHFTLESLTNKAVVYRHFGVNHDCNDSFVFEMRNTTGAKVFGKMVVSVIKQNSTRSVSIRVNPLEFSIIRPALGVDSIVVTDSPVCTEHILFMIQDPPASGNLYCGVRERHLTSGSWFSLRHLKDGLLTYHSDISSTNDSNTYNDSFSFYMNTPIGNLTANGHYLHQYQILYNLSDPMVTLNAPKSLRCDENELLCYCNLSILNINIVSNTASDNELRVVIQDGPSCGSLIVNNTRVSQFTVSQLKKDQVAYELNATLCNNAHYTDQFGFIVKTADQTSRAVKNYYLKLFWSHVMVNQSRIDINETDKTFNITVTRTGYLNDSSSVACTKGSFSGSRCTSCNLLKLAEFSPGQSVAYCIFPMEDNKIAEGESIKKYYVSLKNPKKAIIIPGSNSVTDVYVSDKEDYPVIQFADNISPSVNSTKCTHQITVKEGNNSVASVVLKRIGDSSKEVSVMCTTDSGSARAPQDYEKRDKKRVTFAPGQTTAFCNITIVDDDAYELEELFYLKLHKARMLAETNPLADTLCVYIDDKADLMSVYFSQSRMTVTERVVNSTIYIPIIREGKTNLPEDQNIKVFYEIKLYTNDTANDLDYEEIENNVTFKNLQPNASARLIILSDSISESNETLHVELMERSDYKLGSPSIVTIVIKDDSFVVITFLTVNITIEETDRYFVLVVNRTGYLGSITALNLLLVNQTFSSGDFIVTNHTLFEKNDTQKLIMGFVANNTVYNGEREGQYCLEDKTETVRFIIQCINITMLDEEDYPTINFEFANYTIPVPDYLQECSLLPVAVVRNNDINYNEGIIHYSTLDGSAVAGLHYYESSGVLHFAIGEQRKVIHIRICSHDVPTNQTRKFFIRMEKGNNSTRIVSPAQAEVMIVGKEPTVPFFHKEPIVQSNIELGAVHYNTAGKNFLFCVTACDPASRHYNFSFCSKHGINNNLTIYEWEVSNNNSFYVPLMYSTYFTTPYSQRLDEFYLSPGSRVRCKATAVDVAGVRGYKRPSKTLEIPEVIRPRCLNNGLTVELQPSAFFTGVPQDSIKLTGSLDAAVHAVPILYSHRLHTPVLLLTDYVSRNSSCVLFTGQRHHIGHGGASKITPTDCRWKFEVWMSVKELKKCHANVTRNSNQTSIHLLLELAYFQGNISNGIELEQHRDQLNVLRTFSHKLPPNRKDLNYSKCDPGFIKILEVYFEDFLTIKFQSFANFTGQFLAEPNNITSSPSTHSCSQNNSLFLEDTDQCLHNCTQTWQFHSTHIPVTGPHNVSLIPCVLPDDLAWSPAVMLHCVSMEPVTFQLHMPTSINVFPDFPTVETELLVLKKADNGTHYADWRFGLDDVVYGGIVVFDTLNQQQHVSIEVLKIVACLTSGGYVPQYSDDASLSGCLTHTHLITQLYTIMDIGDVHSGDDFDAKVIKDIENVGIGWSFRIAPLFNAPTTAQQWFIHTMYAISHNGDTIIRHKIRFIQLETPCPSSDNIIDSSPWCEAVVTFTIVLSVLVVMLLALSLACWKWKVGCDTTFSCYRSKCEKSTLSETRRGHRYRAEIQELPHTLLPPNAIHVNMEQCTKVDTHAIGDSTNKRLKGSKKYIVETTM